jgi:hypothetical protein
MRRNVIDEAKRSGIPLAFARTAQCVGSVALHQERQELEVAGRVVPAQLAIQTRTLSGLNLERGGIHGFGQDCNSQEGGH